MIAIPDTRPTCKPSMSISVKMARLLFAIFITGIMLPLNASAQKTLTIINQREAFPIWNVYITPAGQSNWGQDQLGGQTIGAGSSHKWNIPWDGCYVDVKAKTFTGLSVDRRNVNVCGGFEWTLYDKTNNKKIKSLTIINKREAFPIWNVYITPAGQSNWGQDQLGGQTIGAGSSYKWNIPWDGCYVDVKAKTFTGLSVDRRNVNVCGGLEWTLYDN